MLAAHDSEPNSNQRVIGYFVLSEFLLSIIMCHEALLLYALVEKAAPAIVAIAAIVGAVFSTRAYSSRASWHIMIAAGFTIL